MTTRHLLASGTPIDVAGEATAPRAVIVIQEAFGVNDHIRSVAQRFADEEAARRDQVVRETLAGE